MARDNRTTAGVACVEDVGGERKIFVDGGAGSRLTFLPAILYVCVGYTNRDMAIADWVNKVNFRVARSPIGRHFRLEGSGHVCLFVHFLPRRHGNQGSMLTIVKAQRTQRQSFLH